MKKRKLVSLKCPECGHSFTATRNTYSLLWKARKRNPKLELICKSCGIPKEYETNKRIEKAMISLERYREKLKREKIKNES